MLLTRPQIVQELRCGLDAGDEQVVACPRACDVEQVAFGVVHLLGVFVRSAAEIDRSRYGYGNDDLLDRLANLDQLSGTRGGGVTAQRIDLSTGHREALAIRPSSATDLEHGFGGFAKFFVPGKVALAALEAELFERLGCQDVFDDEYISSGGQIHELLTGRDRFVADLRPLAAPGAHACHPYDVCTAFLLEEAGGVVSDPWGAPLDAPLDTTSPVAWVGYANEDLAARIGPVLAELVEDHFGGRQPGDQRFGGQQFDG
jgi:hypothetical protein